MNNIIELKVSELKTDTTYQRTDSLKGILIRDIINNFNPHLLGYLLVSERPDGYYVIDGQHRFTALQYLKVDKVPCLAISGLSQQDEAKIFLKYNHNRYNLTPASMFKAAHAAGDTEAVKIESILSRYCFTIDGKSKNRVSTANNSINAVKAVTRLYSRLTESEFDRTFALLRITWNGAPLSLDGRVITGLGCFVKKCGSCFTNKGFAEKLHTNDPAEIIRIGRSFKGSTSTDSEKDYALAVLRLYNAGKKTARIQETLIRD